MTFATGSGIERWVHCRASAVLPRSFDVEGSSDSARGSESHAYLERIANGMSPEASLGEVDERYQERCKGIDLTDLADVLNLSPEVSFAYHPPTDSARLLGAGLGREYARAGVDDDEIPLTVDVAGIRETEDGTRIGVVVDYKDSHGRVTRAESNWQLRGGALALARTFDLDEVRVQLIYLRDGIAAKRDRAVYTAAHLATFAAELAVRHTLAVADRAAYLETGHEPDSARGSWCRWCPSYFSCPAQMNLIRAAVAGDEVDEILRSTPLAPEVIADAWRRLRDLKRPLKLLESTIYASAKERPILLETLADGTQLWLGVTEVVGNTKIDATIARAVVSDMLGPEAVDEVSKHTVTQALIETAVKARVGRGFGAAKKRAIMTEIEKRGGSHRPTKHDVDVYKVEPKQLAAKVG